jgi:hypothetical protein
MEYYAGIDVSLESSSICVVDGSGRIIRGATPSSRTRGSHPPTLWHKTGGPRLHPSGSPETGFSRGLVFMEFTRPVPTWEEFLQNSAEREIFRKFGTPGEGEKLVLEDNLFIEGVLPNATVRKFTEEEMAVYRAPFTTPESQRPTWRFPNELPIAEEPAGVYSTMEKAHAALAAATYPKLLFAGDPGALVPPAVAKTSPASFVTAGSSSSALGCTICRRTIRISSVERRRTLLLKSKVVPK